MNPLNYILPGIGALVLAVFVGWLLLVIIRRICTGLWAIFKTMQHCYPRADLQTVDAEIQRLQRIVSTETQARQWQVGDIKQLQRETTGLAATLTRTISQLNELGLHYNQIKEQRAKRVARTRKAKRARKR